MGVCVETGRAQPSQRTRTALNTKHAATPPPGPFGHNEQGNITYRGIAYEQSTLGTTPLGLERAREFAAWLNARVAEDEERS